MRIAALLTGLKAKGETVEEMAGFLEAMLSVAERVDPGGVVIDTCGTGGDGLGTFNVSTLAALVVAGAGAKVCKHGGRAASSLTGSADLLEALGVVIDLGAPGVERCIENAGIGFCFAPRFHPAMRHAAAVRRELGVSTVFNMLGPLANPAREVCQVLGVPNSPAAEKMVRVLAARGCRRAMVVTGDDGMDEISLSAPTRILELSEDGRQRAWTLVPEDYGFAVAGAASVAGGDVSRNVAIAGEVLSGGHGPARDIVVLNAAAATVVSGLCATFSEGVEAAQGSIDEGAAARALDGLVAASKSSRAESSE